MTPLILRKHVGSSDATSPFADEGVSAKTVTEAS
jgi:hypothetical protein